MVGRAAAYILALKVNYKIGNASGICNNILGYAVNASVYYKM